MKVKWFSVLGMALMAIRCWSTESFSVNHVTFTQRNDTSGLVDIGCKILCDDPNADIHLIVTAKDAATGKSLPVKHVWVANDSMHTNGL
ncbi:MAG: hypothetical protein J6334_02105, partial [Kiritimatiellae bacterium]|nr:hypothetical protein [Kiritimatiellia bacterium]